MGVVLRVLRRKLMERSELPVPMSLSLHWLWTQIYCNSEVSQHSRDLVKLCVSFTSQKQSLCCCFSPPVSVLPCVMRTHVTVIRHPRETIMRWDEKFILSHSFKDFHPESLAPLCMCSWWDRCHGDGCIWQSHSPPGSQETEVLRTSLSVKTWPQRPTSAT